MTTKEADLKMISFFRQLANDIENNKLSNEQVMRAGKMFMEYKFNENQILSEIHPDDYMKYVITGWYIHNEIDTINRINDDVQMSSKLTSSSLPSSTESANVNPQSTDELVLSSDMSAELLPNDSGTSKY